MDYFTEKYRSKTRSSETLFKRAMKVLPGGVSYGIRYFEPYPFYVARAKGSKLYDVDGNEYVDFWLGHTALILGHCSDVVVAEVREQLAKGTHFGACHELEIELAEQIAKMVPSVEMLRFTNSGTEANMYAVRLARASTGRNKILKFEGGWHGGYDALQVGVKQPFDLAESAGLTVGATQDTIVAPFNDLERARRVVDHESVAAVLVEPVLGSGGGVPADREFLQGLREICDRTGALLIFDEVITGFRLAPGGAQEFFGVKPDISVFGKIIGGGFPVGAFGARSEIMERLDMRKYARPMYSFHGGTFAANPVTMRAGLATLRALENGDLLRNLNSQGERVRQQLVEIFGRLGMEVQIVGAGSIFNVHFSKGPILDAVQSLEANRRSLVEYDIALIANGVFFLPGHNGVLSTAHTQKDVERLLSETENYAKARQHATGSRD